MIRSYDMTNTKVGHTQKKKTDFVYEEVDTGIQYYKRIWGVNCNSNVGNWGCRITKFISKLLIKY